MRGGLYWGLEGAFVGAFIGAFRFRVWAVEVSGSRISMGFRALWVRGAGTEGLGRRLPNRRSSRLRSECKSLHGARHTLSRIRSAADEET